MRPFVPDQLFKSVFDKYTEIEDIVDSPESCDLMCDLTDLCCPAVDALHHVSGFLELANGVQANESKNQYDHFKQTTGTLVKHIMNQLGYDEVSPGSQFDTKISPVFRSGAMY